DVLPDAVAVLERDLEQRVEERVGEPVRLEAELEETGMDRVVVGFLALDARGREVLHLVAEAQLSAGDLYLVGEVADRGRLGELVEDAILTALRGVLDRQLDASHGVPDVEEAARLSAAAVDRQRVPDGRLDAEAVQRRAEHLVVVEPVDESRMAADLVGDR